MHGILIFALLYKYCLAANVTLWMGTDFEDLPCGGGQFNFTWKKYDGKTYNQIYQSEKYPYVSKYYLRINYIDCSDAGSYRCENDKAIPEEPINIRVLTEGGWICWSEWTRCSADCKETRSRMCPKSRLICKGLNVDTRQCLIQCNSKPVVNIPNPSYSVSVGGSVILQCVVVSNPELDGLWWTKDFAETIALHGNKYTGGTSDNPSLTVKEINQSDEGTYSCHAQNAVGISSGKTTVVTQTYKHNSNLNELPVAEKSFNVTIYGVIGGILALVLFVIIGLLIRKKRQHRHNESNQYEQAHFSLELEPRAYDVIQPPNVYSNQCLQDTAHINDISANGNIVTDILEEYNVNDFAKSLCDTWSIKEKIRKEFQVIMSNKCLVEKKNDEEQKTKFDIDGSLIGYMSMKSYVKTGNDGTVSILTLVPSNENLQQFWLMIDTFSVTNIVLMTKTTEKISNFLPTIDKPIKTATHMVEVTSFAKLEEDISKCSFKFWNMAKRTKSYINIYQITNWQVNETHPPIVSLSMLLNIITDTQTGFACFIGSEKTGFPVCGCLSVCFDVVSAIKNDKPFNILLLAAEIKKRLNLFQKIEEYELCYAVTQKYLNTAHVYDDIN